MFLLSLIGGIIFLIKIFVTIINKMFGKCVF